MKLTLSVLDQSPVSNGMTAEEALSNTVKAAQFVEKLGFKRFWLSEHHDTKRVAGSSPEILIAHITASTANIRVGSGGVMLPHYSPYKVAENFKVLEGLTPGRIDLGVGRAPGGMPIATMALQNGNPKQYDVFPEQIDDLIGYLTDSLKEGHPFNGLTATPIIQTFPDVWVLGTSSSSAILAAQKGLPYSFAKFINGSAGEYCSALYHKNFVPSRYLSEPKMIVSVHVFCGETEEEAERMASSLDLSLLLLEQGIRSIEIPSPEQAQDYPYTEYEKERIKENRKRMIVGTPTQVKEQLYHLSESFRTNEIMLVTNTYSFQDRLKSFQLIADEIYLS